MWGSFFTLPSNMTDQKPLLSIIVPMYNVAPYIRECLRSLIFQEVPRESYEILLIDDASTDETLQATKIALAELGTQSDLPRVRLFEQPENHRVGAARNRGLDEAEGKYIWFVDSDDLIPKGFLPKLLPHLQGEVEVLSLQFEEYHETNLPYKVIVPSNPNTRPRDWVSDARITGVDWCYVIRKTLLDRYGLRFPEGLHYCEDEHFSSLLLYYAESGEILPEVGYIYRIRKGSAMTAASLRKAEDLLWIAEDLHRFARNEATKLLSPRIGNYFRSAIDLYFDRGNREQLKFCWNRYKQSGYPLEYLKQSPVLYLRMLGKVIATLPFSLGAPLWRGIRRSYAGLKGLR